MADANKAIELDPSLTKAYLRKGYVCYCYFILGIIVMISSPINIQVNVFVELLV